MNVKERIDADRNQRLLVEEAVRNRQIEAIRRLGLDELYRREFKEVRSRQGILLEELRQLDVVGKLEEILERPIPSLSVYDQVKANPPTRSLAQAVEEYDPEKWEYEILHPTLSYKGFWNEDLLVVLSRGDIIREDEHVSLRYTHSRFLTIAGERTTLARRLPEIDSQRHRMVDDALVLAFREPSSIYLPDDIYAKGYQDFHPWELTR